MDGWLSIHPRDLGQRGEGDDAHPNPNPNANANPNPNANPTPNPNPSPNPNKDLGQRGEGDDGDEGREEAAPRSELGVAPLLDLGVIVARVLLGLD